MSKFQVTLAHKRSDKLDVCQGAYIQPKLDGVRCYTRLVDGEIKMFSRNHKEFFNCEHLKTELHGVFAKYPDLILDGELYNHEYRDNFNKIISLVRKGKPTAEDRAESADKLEYHLYDAVVDGEYGTRLHFLSCLFLDFELRMLKPVQTFLVNNQDAVNIKEEYFLEQGYEGAMLRANNLPYEQRRSHGLQKVKRFNDSEFKITGFIEGRGKFSGGLGKFLGVDLESGRDVEVPWQKITIAQRQDVWKNRDRYINKIATFEWFERTPAGAYRFPQFKAIRNYE